MCCCSLLCINAGCVVQQTPVACTTFHVRGEVSAKSFSPCDDFSYRLFPFVAFRFLRFHESDFLHPGVLPIPLYLPENWRGREAGALSPELSRGQRASPATNCSIPKWTSHMSQGLVLSAAPRLKLDALSGIGPVGPQCLAIVLMHGITIAKRQPNGACLISPPHSRDAKCGPHVLVNA